MITSKTSAPKSNRCVDAAIQLFLGALLPALLLGVAAPSAGSNLGLSVTAPLRRDIDALCDARLTAHSSPLFVRNEFEGEKMSGWSASTSAAEVKAQNNPNFIASEVGSLTVVGKTMIATLGKFSDDDSSETEYCYQNRGLVRMRITIVSGADEMKWFDTNYYIEGTRVGPFLRHRDFLKHRTARPKMPRFDEPVYLSVTHLPFYSLFVSYGKQHRP